MDLTRAEEILIPFCDDGEDSISARRSICPYERVTLRVFSLPEFSIADFIMHRKYKLDKGSPIETRDVSSNVSFDWKREGEVIASGFTVERDSVLD